MVAWKDSKSIRRNRNRKRPARATTHTEPTDFERTKVEQLNIVLRRSKQETHISQQRGSSTDEGTGDKNDESDDGSDDGNDDDNDETVKDGSERDDDDDDNDDEEELAKNDDEDTKFGRGDDEVSESEGESNEEETRQEEEESFDPIPRTPEGSEDEGNDEEDQDLRLSEEARIQEEEEADELYRDVDINQGRGLQLQTNPFVDVVSTIPGIVHQYMTQQMTEAVREAVQIQTDRLQDSFQRENDKFLRNIDENMKKIIKGQALVEDYDADKTILDTYGESTILKRRREDDDQEGPSAGSDRGSKRQKEGGEHASVSTLSETATISAGRSTIGSQSRQLSPRRPPTPDRDWNKTLPAAQGNAQSCISELARQTDARSSFNELLDTPIDFSNFIMNRLSVDTLTPELLAGPTFELMRGSCNSLTELEYHLEEVYKATTDQLDWVNPKGQQYPHNLLQPLPLIPDNRGRRFYGYAVNRESALDVYSKRRIIAVTELKIVELHNYKLLDWISVRRDDDQIYKFKEGDFKRLCLQDIDDMVLLLIQGKLSNLTVKECFAFNVSLRMFTRSIVIQRRVEDLQLGVESYQKRLNLTKPDTYRSDLKLREAYTAYSNPRGFIYQNKDKKNRLMRIDELHKFSDGMLNDVSNALNDRLKGIQMQLRLQDIEDMLLLLVQGKLSNLTVEERFAFNVSLRMFTRSIVIQRHVEDLQMGVESYQKRLNLTKPDMYRSDLKRRKAYTTYSNPRGFIYQNKDKKNRLMRINELYKFSDGTLNDVRTALDDRLKGIRMQYLPTKI
nr:hypothetical protein [Tanacetum cinerariifolium]